MANINSVIGGALTIFDNDNLISLNGLNHIKSVEGELSIVQNDALTSLSGLDNISTVGGFLLIRGNIRLTSLSGLNKLKSVGGGTFNISDNDALTSCCAIQDVLTNGGITGNILIQNNATGCDNKAEILAICDNQPPSGDCNSLDVVGTSGGFFEIANIPAGAKIEYLGRGTGYAVLQLCEGNCGTTQTVSNLAEGEYTVKVQTFNPYCYAEYKVNVADDSGLHCGNQGGDTDGDGVCDNQDNCRNTPNSDQVDNDGDGIGNVCDDTPDGEENNTTICEALNNEPIVKNYQYQYQYNSSLENKTVTVKKVYNSGTIAWSKNYIIRNDDVLDNYNGIFIEEFDTHILISVQYTFNLGRWKNVLFKTDLNGNELAHDELDPISSFNGERDEIVGKAKDGGHYFIRRYGDNANLVKSDATLNPQWNIVMTGDTDSFKPRFIGESTDGLDVYFLIADIGGADRISSRNVNDGTPQWSINSLDFATNENSPPPNFGETFLTNDGGILVLVTYQIGEQAKYFKLDNNGEVLWTLDANSELGNPKTPTTDGGYIFVNANNHITKVNAQGEQMLINCSEENTLQCGPITISNEGNSITMNGQSGKEYFFKIHDLNNGWAEVFSCAYACGSSQTATNLLNGNYLVRVYNASWERICEQEIKLGAAGSRNAVTKLETFTLYPNPAEKAVHIELKEFIGLEGKISIHNLYGQEVYQQNIGQITTSLLHVPLTDFTNGLHLVNLKINNRRIVSKRFMVSRLY